MNTKKSTLKPQKLMSSTRVLHKLAQIKARGISKSPKAHNSLSPLNLRNETIFEWQKIQQPYSPQIRRQMSVLTNLSMGKETSHFVQSINSSRKNSSNTNKKYDNEIVRRQKVYELEQRVKKVNTQNYKLKQEVKTQFSTIKKLK